MLRSRKIDNDETKSKNLFTIQCLTQSGYINLPFNIPRQNIKLVNYRIKFLDAAGSRAAEYIIFSCDWLVNSINSFGVNGIALFPGNDQVTTQACDMEISLGSSINSSFSYNLSAGNIGNFQSLYLTFEYSID